MKDRIRAVRKHFKLTQTQFGTHIGVKGNTITGYEIGIHIPSNAVITSICREFNVNEDWLRNGKGEMFEQSAQSDLAEYANNCGASELELALAKTYFNLPKEIRALLMDELVRCVLGNTAPVSRAELEALEARIAAIEQEDALNGLGGGVSGKNVG